MGQVKPKYNCSRALTSVGKVRKHVSGLKGLMIRLQVQLLAGALAALASK